ncbi:YbaN family protein [Candidatus Poribacteria bacterium]
MSIGFLSLGLGVLGILLPLLPATPFLLLAAWCFYRSSERFHSWLLNHRVFGRHIRNYTESRAIDSKTRWIAITTLWLSIGFSVYFFWHTVFVPILLFVIASVVSWYILRLRTM